MIGLSTATIFSSFFLLLILSFITLIKPGRPLYKSYLVATALILAGTQLFLGLISTDITPRAVISHAGYVIAFLIVLPAAGLPFFHCLGRRGGESAVRRQWIKVSILTALVLGGAIIADTETFIGKIHFSAGGGFWGFTFTTYGKGLAVYVLISNIFYMHLFENTYRLSNIPGKVTLKYPMLGMILATVINFILISYLLATSVIDINFITIQACGVIICALTFIYAGIRYELPEVQTRVGPADRKSVSTVTVSGLYFIVLAVVSYISAFIEMPYSRIILLVPTIFIIFLIIAGIISGRFRRRFRLFLNENVYPSRYNYRKEWNRFSRLMGSSLTLNDLLSNAIGFICETMMVKTGVIWIDIRGGKTDSYNYPPGRIDNSSARRLSGITGESNVITIRSFSRLMERGEWEPGDQLEKKWGWIKVMAPLKEGNRKRGFIALGKKHWNLGYNVEDREFLETIAMEISLNLENIILSEKMMESKQLESFNRFSSHVIHDLKNMVGMLSLSTENARDNINNPAFQEDLISTLERSVEKMRSLISSLSSVNPESPLNREGRNLHRLISGKVEQLKRVARFGEVVLKYNGREDVTFELDDKAFKRALENIIYNAIEATPSGGTVTVEMDQPEDGDIEIAVCDTGSGFDPGYLEDHLFTPFKSTKKGGLGLGLTISRNIVEAHNGRMEIENRSQGGACVTITLPGDS